MFFIINIMIGFFSHEQKKIIKLVWLIYMNIFEWHDFWLGSAETCSLIIKPFFYLLLSHHSTSCHVLRAEMLRNHPVHPKTNCSQKFFVFTQNYFHTTYMTSTQNASHHAHFTRSLRLHHLWLILPRAPGICRGKKNIDGSECREFRQFACCSSA